MDFLFSLFERFFYKIKSKLFNFIQEKIFFHPIELRSNSETKDFLSAITLCSNNPKKFFNFKRNFYIKSVIETVNKKLGAEYLKLLESRNDNFLKRGLNSVLISDEIGNPVKYKYSGYSLSLAPTTLRYLKVASDLNFLFGNSFKKVAEIGCGYGGQTLVNDQMLNIELAKLFDLPNVNELIKKYLNSHLLRGSFKTTFINEQKSEDYDLVISNYAFSELPKILQLKYIEKVLMKSKRGYLTMNTGIKNYDNSKNKLSLNEISEFLPDIKILEEEPFGSFSSNYIIVWGNNNKSLSEYFKLKNI